MPGTIQCQPQYHVTLSIVTWYSTLLADWSVPYVFEIRENTLVEISAEI